MNQEFDGWDQLVEISSTEIKEESSKSSSGEEEEEESESDD